MSIVSPEWLIKISGQRELDVINAPDAKISNFVEENSMERFPCRSMQYRILSASRGEILVCAKTKKIIG